MKEHAVTVPLSLLEKVEGNANKYYALLHLGTIEPDLNLAVYGSYNNRHGRLHILSLNEMSTKRQEKERKGYRTIDVDAFRGEFCAAIKPVIERFQTRLPAALNKAIPDTIGFRLEHKRGPTALVLFWKETVAKTSYLSLDEMNQVYI